MPRLMSWLLARAARRAADRLPDWSAIGPFERQAIIFSDHERMAENFLAALEGLPPDQAAPPWIDRGLAEGIDPAHPFARGDRPPRLVALLIAQAELPGRERLLGYLYEALRRLEAMAAPSVRERLASRRFGDDGGRLLAILMEPFLEAGDEAWLRPLVTDRALGRAARAGAAYLLASLPDELIGTTMAELAVELLEFDPPDEHAVKVLATYGLALHRSATRALETARPEDRRPVLHLLRFLGPPVVPLLVEVLDRTTAADLRAAIHGLLLELNPRASRRAVRGHWQAPSISLAAPPTADPTLGLSRAARRDPPREPEPPADPA